MHELALRLAGFGRIFLIADVAICVSAFGYLIFQVARRGRVGADQGRVVNTHDVYGELNPAIQGISRKKVFYSRTKFVSTASLVNGTASRQDWILVITFNVAMISLVMIFLGVGLIQLPEGQELGFSVGALIFIAFPLVVVPLMLKMQFNDFRKTREKLRQKKEHAIERRAHQSKTGG